MNWFAAAEYCYYQNAMLAQIPDLSTQTFLEHHASEIHTGKPDFWLGATDIYMVNYLQNYKYSFQGLILLVFLVLFVAYTVAYLLGKIF